MSFCAQCGASVQGRFCAICGAATQSAGSSPPPPPQQRQQAPSMPDLQPNIVAVLCYVSLIISGFFWPLSLMAFVAPIVFLVVEPYKNLPFIRFHAVQSLLVSIVFFVVALITGATIGDMTGFGSGVFGLRGSGSYGLYLVLANVLVLLRIGCGAFLMSKAYLNQRFAIPAIGEFASSLADQIKY
jgi:uncharacterized membrane protein